MGESQKHAVERVPGSREKRNVTVKASGSREA